MLTRWRILQHNATRKWRSLFILALEKACSHETRTTEVKLNELIDFKFAELKRRVGRAVLALAWETHEIANFEDDYLDLHLVAQDSAYEMQRSEAVRLAAARRCTELADR